jgi:hypothetical protein
MLTVNLNEKNEKFIKLILIDYGGSSNFEVDYWSYYT